MNDGNGQVLCAEIHAVALAPSNSIHRKFCLESVRYIMVLKNSGSHSIVKVVDKSVCLKVSDTTKTIPRNIENSLIQILPLFSAKSCARIHADRLITLRILGISTVFADGDVGSSIPSNIRTKHSRIKSAIRLKVLGNFSLSRSVSKKIHIDIGFHIQHSSLCL